MPGRCQDLWSLEPSSKFSKVATDLRCGPATTGWVTGFMVSGWALISDGCATQILHFCLAFDRIGVLVNNGFYIHRSTPVRMGLFLCPRRFQIRSRTCGVIRGKGEVLTAFSSEPRPEKIQRFNGNAVSTVSSLFPFEYFDSLRRALRTTSSINSHERRQNKIFYTKS